MIVTNRIESKDRRPKAAAKNTLKKAQVDLTNYTYHLDAKPENADWPKRTWDLGIDNVEDLRAYLSRTGTPVADFKRLPVYRWNLEKLPWLKEL
jgi:hypothetical protein